MTIFFEHQSINVILDIELGYTKYIIEQHNEHL